MPDLLKALNLTSTLFADLDDADAISNSNNNNNSGSGSGSIISSNNTFTILGSGLVGDNLNASSLNATIANATASSAEKLDLSNFDLPSNYSVLINKLEQLALGLDSALGNITIDRQEVEINLGGTVAASDVADVADDLLFKDVITAPRAPPPRVAHGSRIYRGDDGDDYAHVVSDIWIGVILTLLIVFVIFFICACFLYHKFQQWKHSYRANHNEPTIEICRRCPPDYEVESLPSYTIVSGLPTYDDALEEFRKAGIILTPAVVPVIKIFESANDNGSKEPAVAYTLVETGNGPSADNADNISLNSVSCSCGGGGGGGGNSPTNPLPTYSAATTAVAVAAAGAPHTSQVIELSPEHLAALSQKRLSLQISFNNSVRRTERSGATLRNHLLRSRAVGNTAGLGPVPTGNAARDSQALPSIHRSSSTVSLSLTNEGQLLDQRLRHLHHRGSLY
ncbi:uncharacterized protein LOC115622419 [Scaptodrosophila lebanonensis]|uniref:Uncharacterized protein LOC115622419 n=1 Tax=Drosophila lebanonensis TaxID=7225 RepID=A0A6J2T894_DROLE|nr:uncharacterized protein LOC115622419 [Scaptodrosophila lebanonensis]